MDFYNNWMSTTDGRAYDFLWKNFRFEKKIVPGKDNYSKGTAVIKCWAELLMSAGFETVYNFIAKLKIRITFTDYNQIFLCRSV